MSMISWRQSKCNNLSFKSNQFNLKHETLLIRRLLDIETSSKERVLHNFLKYFPGAGVNQILNKYLNVQLSGLYNLLFSAP